MYYVSVFYGKMNVLQISNNGGNNTKVCNPGISCLFHYRSYSIMQILDMLFNYAKVTCSKFLLLP